MSRIKLELLPKDEARLTIHYKHHVQSMLYSNISEELSTFLHDYGFQVGKRRFKLFTFSDLMGRFKMLRNSKEIKFLGPVYLYVSSPIQRFVNELGTTILRKGYVYIDKTPFIVRKMEVLRQPEIGNEHKIKTLSPITIYSTLYTPEGGRKTYYYSPYEREFSTLATKNAVKKFFALHRKKIDGYIELKPVRVEEKILKYKGTIIKGWKGIFIIRGSPKLIETVYQAGVGSKNSQGFGMFEVIN